VRPVAERRDVVVVGGGHNGLVAAAYLARAGLDTLVCERREVPGGAAVSEHPFGPDYTITSLSYVVSLLPPDIAADLRLERHGFHVYPQGPYFAPRRDGRALRLPGDPGQRHAEIARFSERDAGAYDAYERHLAGLGAVLGPLLHEIPPRLGSRRPADLLRQARLLARLRTIDERGAVDVTRLLTGSVADLLDRYFESDAVRGVLSVSGVIGTWAGPRSAGTAYVLLHHHIGEADGQAGAWGFPRGGMGAVTGALAGAARSFGAEIRTAAEVARIRTRDGRVAGVTLASGEEIGAATVVTTAHPRISFLRLLDPAELPPEFLADIRAWQSRSGTVKINLALDRLPVFASHPEPDPEVYGGTIVLAESLDDVETAFQEAVSGRPSALPFADICIPSVFDDSLAPPGKHVMSLFTQWVPHAYADSPDPDAIGAYADRVLARVEAVAPGFTGSVLHRQVIAPHQMQDEYGLVGGNIFHGELSLGQMFHARPAAGYADLRTPVRGLYQAGSSTHGGGGVTGIPGRNVVRQVLADRRAERWRRLTPAPGRRSRLRVRADERGDHRAEAFAGVLLEEVPGSFDHRVLDAGRAGHGALQDGRHTAGDRVAVAERDQKRPVPGGELAPGRAVGRRRRVIRACRDQVRHRPHGGGEGLIRERRVVGGQHLRRQRRPAAGLHQPGNAQRGRCPDDLTEPQPDLGHRLVAGGQPGVGGHHAREPAGVLGHQPQPDQPAPVLPDERQPAQVKLAEGESTDPLHVPFVRVVRYVGGLVRPAEPDEVRRDRTEPRGREHRHDRPVQERPARLPVQQKNRLAVGRPGLDVGHPQAAHIGVPRRVAETRNPGEPVLGGAQHFHVPNAAMGAPACRRPHGERIRTWAIRIWRVRTRIPCRPSRDP